MSVTDKKAIFSESSEGGKFSLIDPPSKQKNSTKSHSIIGKISFDDDNSEENKSQCSIMNQDEFRVKFQAKPKTMIILAKDFDKIFSKQAKISIEITESSEICLCLKDSRPDLVENFKNTAEIIDQKLKNYSNKIIVYGQSISHLKSLLESSTVLELMQKYPDMSLFMYSDFRDVCDRLRLRFQYSKGIDYFREKSSKKQRFCFLSCLKENFPLIEAEIKKRANPANNANIEKFEIVFPPKAKITEDFVKDFLNPELNAQDFDIKHWLFGNKLIIEIQALKKTARKMKEEIEKKLLDFNKNAVYLTEIKDELVYRYLQNLLIHDVSGKSEDYGLKCRVFSSKVSSNQLLVDPKSLYQLCKAASERSFPLASDPGIRYFFAIKGNEKTLAAMQKSFSEFLSSIKPKPLKFPFKIPIKTPQSLASFIESYFNPELSMAIQNNRVVYSPKSLKVSDGNLEMMIWGAGKRWPLLEGDYLDPREQERSERLWKTIENFLESVDFRELEKSRAQVEAFLQNSGGGINSLQEFQREFDVFIEESPINKLLLVAKSKEQLEEALAFLSCNDIEIKEVFIENRLVLQYLMKNPSEIKKLSPTQNFGVILDESAKKAIISSPNSEFYANLSNFQSLLDKLKSRIVTKELHSDQPSVQSLSQDSLQKLEEKYQCEIEISPTLSPIPENSSYPLNRSPEILLRVGPMREKLLSIVHCDIFKQNTESLVVPVDDSLLFNGGIAQFYRAQIGPNLDDFIAKVLQGKGKSLAAGECLFCALRGKSFNSALLVVSPKFGNDGAESLFQKEYKRMINKMMELANSKGVKTITLPVIGSGNNQLPIKQACKLVLQFTIDYLNSNVSSIQKVSLIEHDFEKFRMLAKEVKFLEENRKEAASQKKQKIAKTKEKYQWSWNFWEKADENYFEDYDAELSDLIEKSYQQKLETVDISGHIAISYPVPSHSFDFSTFQATHLRLGTSKRFFRKSACVWCFDESNGKEALFPGKICEILEDFYNRRNFKKPFQIFINNYRIHLTERKDSGGSYFIQENIDTGFLRKVKRQKKKVAVIEFAADLDDLNLDISVEKADDFAKKRHGLKSPDEENSKGDSSACIKVRGINSQSLNRCVDELQDQLNHLIEKVEFPSSKELEDDLDAVNSLAERLKIKIYYLTDQRLVCSGVKNSLLRFLEYLKVKYLLLEKIYPDNWGKIEDFSLCEVSKTSIEFEGIVQKFKNSMERPVKVTRIGRVENMKLWLDYVKEKRNLLEKYESFEIAEEDLFLKVEDLNNLETVIKDEGINRLNSSKEGILGKGIYLSKQAKAFHGGGLIPSKNKKHQILFCRTLVGVIQKAKEAQKDRTSLEFIGDSISKTYDSLEYVSSQSVIIVIFNDHRVYPEYLIDYLF